jgi:hypothetical protein
MKEIGSINFAAPHAVTSQAFDKAGEYCAVEAAAIALETWLANHSHAPAHIADAQWLVLALARLNACLGHKTEHSGSFIEGLADQLVQLQMHRPPFENLALSAA